MSDIKKQESDNQKCSCNLRIGGNIQKFVHFSNSSSMVTTTNKHNIPNRISVVNIKIPSIDAILEKFGVINATPNHPAERFPNNAESARSQGLLKLIRIAPTVAEPVFCVN